ncbi:hypothetical protein ACHHYP_11063 [Achlya hypogyna]|uniref:peptide-methionine (S)-S-oxide reductase n=1 Tax=Achlya hypogyna TaxID=1202772 RepID=A0A1V9YK17_ACHHY|nr:hypothetical protein ACHHYP_11063 [Achlya hypogyna]
MADDGVASLSAFLSTTTDFAPAVCGRAQKRRLYPTPKEELDYLRAKHRDLSQRLATLQAQRHMVTEDGSWKTRARDMTIGAQMAVCENERLKAMLQDQMHLVNSLKRALSKRPKLAQFQALVTDTLWRQAILGTTQRHEDLERLMQLQYEKLGSTWIREGLADAMDNGAALKTAQVGSALGEETMELCFARGAVVSLPFRVLANLLWDQTTTDGVDFEILHSFTSDLVYLRAVQSLPDPEMPALEVRLVGRRWSEPDRTVFAWRTVVEDKLIPHDANHVVEKRVSWMTISRRTDEECYIAVHSKVSTPIFPDALRSKQPTVGTLTELMLKLHHDNTTKYTGLVGQAIRAKMAERGTADGRRVSTTTGSPAVVREDLATFAAGCFWSVQLNFQRVPGVLESHVGYINGTEANPTYVKVCTGETGHAEAVQIKFDPSVISYDALLDKFWSIHDPTTINQQKNDVGTQYRSGIYYHSETQKALAIASKSKAQPNFQRPIVTEIAPAQIFFVAEEYHQRYLEKGGQCARKGSTDTIRCYG